MPALETAAPFHEVRIHPRTGAVVPLNIGWLSPLLSTDDDWYDPEELTVAVHANFDGRYGVRLSAVPRNGSVVVLDMSNPSSAVQLTQTTSTPGIGEFWVAEQGAQADYGQVNLGFGFVEVHSSMNGVLLEVHYQSVGSVLSNDVINDKIETEIIAQLVASTPYPPDHMAGLTLANNGSDPTNDIDIAAGSARDATNAENMILASALTKRLDAAWAVGTNQGMLDTGAVGNNTYHIWLIKRSDTGVVDVLASLSASSPTMPANYDYKRYLWPITRSGGSNVQFKQTGRRFQLVTPVLYSTGANPGTSRITAALTAIPTGISLIAIVQFGCRVAECLATCRPLTETNAAPSGSAAPYWDAAAWDIGGGLVPLNAELEVVTDTSAQVAVRLSASGSGQIANALQKGWIVP